MTDRTGIYAAVVVVFALFLGVQLGALALVEPLTEADRQAVENPDDPTNSLVFFAVILVATAFMLAAFKYDADRLIRAVIVGVSVMLSWFVFLELLPATVSAGGVHVPALVAAFAVGGALLVYPEWYVIDAAGVLMGAGAAGLFGISFGLLPAIIFLVVLAVYDAISVYRTKHMLSLADGVMDLKIPVVFVVPTSRSFSYLAPEGRSAVLDDELDGEGVDDTAVAAVDDEADGEADAAAIDQSDADEDSPAPERDALFVGLGDAVIPTILVASAASFLDATVIEVPLIALNAPALGAIVGTMVGLFVLMGMVLKGRPHAGLPLLNGGAIAGYLVGALASGISIATALGL